MNQYRCLECGNDYNPWSRHFCFRVNSSGYIAPFNSPFIPETIKENNIKGNKPMNLEAGKRYLLKGVFPYKNEFREISVLEIYLDAVKIKNPGTFEGWKCKKELEKEYEVYGELPTDAG